MDSARVGDEFNDLMVEIGMPVKITTLLLHTFIYYLIIDLIENRTISCSSFAV